MYLLVGDELVIDAVVCHEFVVTARFLHSPVLDAEDDVGVLDGGQTMSNHERCATFTCLGRIK